MLCYCSSGKRFSDCCEPIVAGNKVASSAETLMRSRYSAYAIGAYNYILQTYSAKKRATLTEAALAADCHDTKWIRLQVVAVPCNHEVEFKAWYTDTQRLFLLHETSTFITEQGEWKYHTGLIHTDTGLYKPGRNEVCVCGSAKKYKKCCMGLYS